MKTLPSVIRALLFSLSLSMAGHLPGPEGAWGSFPVAVGSRWFNFCLSSAWVSNNKGDSWAQIPGMAGANSVFKAGTLYVLGDGIIVTADSGRTWEQIPVSGFEFWSTKPMAVCQGRLFLPDHDTVRVLDLQSRAWSDFPAPWPLPSGGYIVGLLSVGERLYLFSSESNAYYAENGADWTGPLPHPELNLHSLRVIDDKIQGYRYDTAYVFNPDLSIYRRIPLPGDTDDGSFGDFIWLRDTCYLQLTTGEFRVSNDNGIVWALSPAPVFQEPPRGEFHVLDGALCFGQYSGPLFMRDGTAAGWRDISRGIRSLGLRNLLFSRAGAVFTPYGGNARSAPGFREPWSPLPVPDSVALEISRTYGKAVFEDTLYAITEEMGFFKSPDLGQTWAKASNGPDFGQWVILQNSGIFTIHEGIFFVANNDGGLHRSLDRGFTWTTLRDRELDRADLSFGPCLAAMDYFYDPETFGSFKQIYHSLDSGITWTLELDSLRGGVSFGSNDGGVYLANGGVLQKAVGPDYRYSAIATPAPAGAVYPMRERVYLWSFKEYTGNYGDIMQSELLYSDNGGADWVSTNLRDRYIVRVEEIGDSVYVGALFGEVFILDRTEPFLKNGRVQAKPAAEPLRYRIEGGRLMLPGVASRVGIDIRSLSGRLLVHAVLPAPAEGYSLAALPPGIYSLELTTSRRVTRGFFWKK